MKRIFFLLLLVPALSFCPLENTLYLSTTSDPKTFNLIISNETSSSGVLAFLFEGLTERDGITLEIKPSLAKSWKYSPDGKRWTFNLREDVKWFDGMPFTADDVVFTYNRLIYNKDIPTSAKDVFTIDGKKLIVKKLGTYTIEFTLPKPFAPLLHQLGFPILPKHILKRYVDSKTFTSAWGVNTKPREIIGTGPFMMKEYKPGERITYIRNPNYWKRDKDGNRFPYIERIVTFIVPDREAQLASFQAGEIDILSVMGKDFANLKEGEKSGNYTLYNCGPAFGTTFVAFNQSPIYQKKAWFSNHSFRRAIAHCIDKKTIINNCLSGLGFPQDSSMEEAAGFFYNPNVIKYAYNPRKARKILDEIGFIDRNKDGIREDRNGCPIKFILLTNAENTQGKDIGAIITKDLRDIGLGVTFAPIDFNKLVEMLTSSHNWDAVLIGFTGVIEPHSGKNVWESTGQLHLWNPEPQNEKDKEIWKINLSPWEKEIDKIFNKGCQELDNKKRKLLYDRWQYIVSENLPLLYTVNPASLYAVRNRLLNIHPTSYGGVLHNLPEVRIKEELSHPPIKKKKRWR
ncbi:MAG: ABC transporter substrate-binding protein [bacterium]